MVVLTIAGCVGGGGMLPGRPTATPIPYVYDNKGEVCFEWLPPTGTGVIIHAGPNTEMNCWSSSCSVRLAESHAFTVKQESRTLQFTWYVTVREEYGGQLKGQIACTADCGGLPTWEYTLDDVPEGEYTVKIGDNVVGTVQIPYQGASATCLSAPYGNGPTPTPSGIFESPLAVP